MKGIKLTKRSVDAARYQGSGAYYVWDCEVRGFGLRVYPSALKSFVVTYRVRGKQRFYTIGRYGELTVDEARTKALQALGRARNGEDPAGQRLASRRAPTMVDLAERYMREHAEVRKKPAVAKADRQTWERLILPRYGKRKVADIERCDVTQLHTELAATPAMANHTRGLLSTAFNLAEVWGWRAEGTNPCRHVKKFKAQARERYYSEVELSRLGAVLTEAERSWGESPHAVAAIRLLILTGCRSVEILTLRWDYVDFERQCLHLPDSKTGKKTVRLNAPALRVLADIERVDGSPWVIPGKAPGKPLRSLRGLWAKICQAAELRDARIHDLRHTFASFGVNSGHNLPVIGKLLGHSKTATTERYAHLADHPVRAANEQIGATLEATLAGAPKAEVAPINREASRR
ncbi:MAG TPA: site-specific integrase [Thermoanaerobaculia bacterium]|jgi:integrase